VSTTFSTEQVNACCAAAYSHPAARFLLGESLHPGGLDLTRDLATRLGLQAGQRVLDAGCGPGASATLIASEFDCEVIGVTLEESAAAEAKERAAKREVAGSVEVLVGDMMTADLANEGFDAAIAECVVSIFPDKPAGLQTITQTLKPGGRLGITDVTVDGALPSPLRGVLAVAGCVGDAMPLDAYAELIQRSGLEVEATDALPGVAADFVKGIRNKLMFAEIGAKLGKIPLSAESINEAKAMLNDTAELIEQGLLGYGMVIARKP
jgi:SAM-dependent methyltransferase